MPAGGPGALRTGASPSAAAEQHDAVAANLGGVALVAVLVVPLPRLQAALDVDLLALHQVLAERLGGLSPEHHAVPLRFLLALSAFVVPHLGGGHVEGGDRRASWCVTQLGVAPEIADENHFVDASHATNPFKSAASLQPAESLDNCASRRSMCADSSYLAARVARRY